MLFNRQIRYRAPGGQYYELYADMLRQTHLLIAGATGSGKSVVINGMICTAILQGPDQASFILIDPKRVELVQYKGLPHTIRYASEPAQIIQALNLAVEIIESRYIEMQKQRRRETARGNVYIIIDELADLMTTQKKEAQPLIQRIAQIGRAAHVHLVVATQSPIREVIGTPIKCNIDARVGLRTRSAQDSRNILGLSGCEHLPRYGQGFYMTPEGVTLYSIPMYSAERITALVDYWTSRKCIAA